jgi:cyanate permease
VVLLSGVACLSLASTWSIWPGVALFGFGWGASYTLTQAQVMERWRGPFLGRLTGLIVLIEGLSAGLGSFMGGWFHDAFGSYTVAYAVMTASVGLALAGSVLLTQRMARRLRLA